jgi:hypothetical protein
MRAGTKIGIALLCAIGLTATATATASAPASATPKSTCDLTFEEGQHLGASYVDPFTVKNTSCSKGENVIKAFNKCRKDNGGRDGHCNSSVLGYSCNEGKRTAAPAQYFADVVCKDGSKKVKFHYTQNT